MRQKVILLDIKSKYSRVAANKDLAGGLGTATLIGKSLRARLLEYMKHRSVSLPVMSLGYLAAIFQEGGWDVKVLRPTEPLKHETIDADLILVPISIVDYKHEVSLVEHLPTDRTYKVGFYGTFASTMPQLFLPKGDFVINGEPEQFALDIAAGAPLPNKGDVVVSKHVEDLDSLPFPNWDQFPVHQYSYKPALMRKPIITMLASRGCPYSCYFYCPYPILEGRKVRKRSPKNVVDEMLYMKERYNIQGVDFRDPIFGIDKKWGAEFVNELLTRKVDMHWSCETRLDILTEEILEQYYQAGMRNLNIGVESSSDDILKSSKRKPIEIQHQEKIINFCHKKGIHVAAFYIIGLETDTPASVLRTIKYAKKLNTGVAGFSISTPYPGTGFYKQVEDKIFTTDYEQYNNTTPVYQHDGLTPKQMLKLKQKAWQEYYFRPAWLWRYMMIRPLKYRTNCLWNKFTARQKCPTTTLETLES